ncbi:MAG TPA: FAD binding domain-containing protein [Gaiellaceae bacterium]|nr:FAD binding domain-containing protein [Gaiellaceae bacterium]
MKPAPFRYVRAESVEEVLAALAGEDAKVLAGGQSLLPALNMRLVRPAALVDINRVRGLDNIARSDGALVVGAAVRQADPRLLEHPLLRDALPHVGHFVTRNRGTVCGSIAHADAAGELPLCLVLLGGTVRVASARSEREIAAEDFFLTHFTTALQPGELVVETMWPEPQDGWSYAFCELAQRHGDYALCMAAAAVRGDELRVAIGSVVERPTLLEVDPGQPGESAASQVEPWGNFHASTDYLRHLVRVLVDRAVATATERAAT